MDILTIAIFVLVCSSIMAILIAISLKLKGKKREPSWVNVISPIIEGYVLYGLLTTASAGAVTNYVYLYGFLLFLLFVAGTLSLVVND
jgi:hypothetical protein